MKILQRREFLKKLGYLMAGGLIVPKVFYSFPHDEILFESQEEKWLRLFYRINPIEPSPFASLVSRMEPIPVKLRWWTEKVCPVS